MQYCFKFVQIPQIIVPTRTNLCSTAGATVRQTDRRAQRYGNYVNTSMKQRPFDKLVVPQLVNKFTFYSSRKLIAVFTTARHCHQAHKAASCRPSYIFEIHFNIILPSMSRTSKWSLSFRYPHQTLYILLFSPILVTRPVCFILHHVITLITCCEDYKS